MVILSLFQGSYHATRLEAGWQTSLCPTKTKSPQRGSGTGATITFF